MNCISYCTKINLAADHVNKQNLTAAGTNSKCIFFITEEKEIYFANLMPNTEPIFEWSDHYLAKGLLGSIHRIV